MGTLMAGLDSLTIQEPIFKDVKCYLSGEVPDKITELLRNGGAELTKYFSDFVTHLVCGANALETDLTDANDLYEIPAATCQWVIACVNSKKLVSTRPYNPSTCQLFTNVVACIDKVSGKDTKTLYSLITFNGGQCKLNLNSTCTHLIVGSASGVKYTTALGIPSEKLKIVTPDWVLDSIKSKIQCAADIYHPRLLKLTPVNLPQPIVSSAPVESRISTITGFDFEEGIAKTELPTQNLTDNKDLESTQALLDKLKQRMPWNHPVVSTNVASPGHSTSSIVVTAPMPMPSMHQAIINQNVAKSLNNIMQAAPTSQSTSQASPMVSQGQMHQTSHASSMVNTQHHNQQTAQPHGLSAIQIQQQRLLQQHQLRMQMLQQQKQIQNKNTGLPSPQQGQNFNLQQHTAQQQLAQLQQQNHNILPQQQIQNAGQLINSSQQQTQNINQSLTQSPSNIQIQNQTVMGQQSHFMQKQNQGLLLKQQGQALIHSQIQSQLSQAGNQNLNLQANIQQMNQNARQISQQQLGTMQQQGQIITQQGQIMQQQGQIVSQGQIIAQQQGQVISQPQGQVISQPQGQVLSQQHGQVMSQQQGQVMSQQQQGQVMSQQQQGQVMSQQQQGQVMSQQQQGQVISQQQSQVISQQQGKVMSQQQGQVMSQQQGQVMSQQGQMMSQQGQIVPQHGQIISQQQGQIISQQGQIMNQQQGQIISQQQGQIISQQQGQMMSQQHGQIMSQQQGSIMSQVQQNQNINLSHQTQNISLSQQNQLLLSQQQQNANLTGTQNQNIVTSQSQVTQNSSQINQIVASAQQSQAAQLLNQQLQQHNQQGVSVQGQQGTNVSLQQTWRQMVPNSPQSIPQNPHQLVRSPMLQQRAQQNQMLLQQQLLQNQQQNIISNQQQSPQHVIQQQSPQHIIQQQSPQHIIQQQSPQHIIQQQSPQQLQGQQQILVQKQLQVQQQQQTVVSQQQIIVNQQQIGNSAQQHQQILMQGGQHLTQQLISQGGQTLQQPPQQATQQSHQTIVQSAQQIVNQASQQIINQAGQQIINQAGQQIINQAGQQIINQAGQQIINQANQQLINQAGQQISLQGGQQQQAMGSVQQIIAQAGQQIVQQQGGQMLWAQQQQQQFLQQRQQQIIAGQPGAVGPRVSWTAGGGGRQLIHLDAQTHAQLRQMDPQERALFVAQIQKRRQLSLHRAAIAQHQQQHGGGAVATPGGVVSAGGTAQSVTFIRGQIPPGLTPQQQVQWLQQQGARATVASPQVGATPGQQQVVTPVTGVTTAVGANVLDSQYAQLQLQRQQHYQRLQQLQAQRDQTVQQQHKAVGLQGITVQTRIPGVTEAVVETPVTPTDQNVATSPLIVNPKTKTALANMLSIRLQGASAHSDGQEPPSAAGTLRLMTAAHNAPPRAPVPSGAAPGTASPSVDALAPNARLLLRGAAPPHVAQHASHPGHAPHHPHPQAQTHHQGAPKLPMSVGGRAVAPPPRAQFYGHNPNLKLPPDLFLLGCVFHIVEYQQSLSAEKVNQWMEMIGRRGGEVEAAYCARVTHVLCETQRHGVVMQALRDAKRCITAYWLSDTMLRKCVSPPWQALHVPRMWASRERPAKRHLASLTGWTGEERHRLKCMIEHVGTRWTPYLSRDNTVLVCRRPEGPKYKKAKDNGIPVVSALWLTDLLLGNMTALTQIENAKYQQFNLASPFRMDYTLVPHLMNAWKMPINITQESHERAKRALPSLPLRKAKRPRLEDSGADMEIDSVMLTTLNPPEPQHAPRVIFSGARDAKQLSIIVKQLGGHLAHKPLDATHLVMDSLARTSKLVSCLITVRHVLASEWLKESQKQNQFLDEAKYAFKDDFFDDTFKCNIHEVLSQGDNRRRLFEGITFYLTPSVQPSRIQLTEMIELSGGKVDKNRKSFVSIQEMHKARPHSYLVLTSHNDLHLVYYLLQSDRGVNVVCNTEIVMTAIMRQKLEVDPFLVKID